MNKSISVINICVPISGAPRVRGLPPEQFCKQGFVLGKASEAGFGNEMYKILTAAGLSIMLNRSLIIGQTRHIGPFSCLLSSFCYDFLAVTLFIDLFFSSSTTYRVAHRLSTACVN